MDFELKQIGQTISIGAFGFLCIRSIIFDLYLLYIKIKQKDENVKFSDLWIFKYVKAIAFTESDSNKFLLGSAYFAVLFALGIVLEDLSKNITSTRINDNLIYFCHTIPLIPGFDELLPKDKTLRINNFFKIERKGGGESTDITKINHSNISKDFQSSGALDNYSKITKVKFKNLDSLICLINDSIRTGNGYSRSLDTLSEYCSRLYYLSKNIVYKEENYYNEMSGIASRIDFERALILLSFSAFVFNLFLWPVIVLYIIYVFFKGDKAKVKNLFRSLTKTAPLTFLFYIIMFMCSAAYISDSTNYLLRVYGYFITINAEK